MSYVLYCTSTYLHYKIKKRKKKKSRDETKAREEWTCGSRSEVRIRLAEEYDTYLLTPSIEPHFFTFSSGISISQLSFSTKKEGDANFSRSLHLLPPPPP